MRRKPCTTMAHLRAKSMPITSAWRTWTLRSNWRKGTTASEEWMVEAATSGRSGWNTK